MRLLHHDAGRLAHGTGILAVDLYGDGAFLGADLQLEQTLVHQADEGIARHELRVDHCGPHLPAKQTETDVGDVLHRCQQDRPLAKVNRSDSH